MIRTSNSVSKTCTQPWAIHGLIRFFESFFTILTVIGFGQASAGLTQYLSDCLVHPSFMKSLYVLYEDNLPINPTFVLIIWLKCPGDVQLSILDPWHMAHDSHLCTNSLKRMMKGSWIILKWKSHYLDECQLAGARCCAIFSLSANINCKSQHPFTGLGQPGLDWDYLFAQSEKWWY